MLVCVCKPPNTPNCTPGYKSPLRYVGPGTLSEVGSGSQPDLRLDYDDMSSLGMTIDDLSDDDDAEVTVPNLCTLPHNHSAMHRELACPI